MAFVFAIPEAVLRGLYLNFRFLFKEGNPLFSESQTQNFYTSAKLALGDMMSTNVTY